MVKFLVPFDVLTKFVDRCKYPTLSNVVPLYNQIVDTIAVWSRDETQSIEIRHAAVIALDKLIKYYDKTSDIYLIATVMDPRLKINIFQRQGWADVNGKNLIDTVVTPA